MAKTMLAIDDTKMSSGGMKMEIDGEEVLLENDGDHAFKCNVRGKKYRFSDEEIAAMLHDQLKK